VRRLADANEPKNELRDPASEWSVLVIISCRQFETVSFLLLRLQRLWCQESDEKVENINPKGVGHDVPALREVDANGVDEQLHCQENPSVHGVWLGLVNEVVEFSTTRNESKDGSNISKRAAGSEQRHSFTTTDSPAA